MSCSGGLFAAVQRYPSAIRTGSAAIVRRSSRSNRYSLGQSTPGLGNDWDGRILSATRLSSAQCWAPQKSEAAMSTSPPTHQPASNRVASIDIYRGMVMFLMLAEVLSLPKLKKLFGGDGLLSQLANWIAFHTSHVEWAGGSLHDMIQPGFSFLVGTAMAYSLLARKGKRESFRQMLRHAVLRSIVLVLLGIFLRSLGKPQTNFTFDDTLTQIGLGYWALFLIAQLPIKGVIACLILILVGYWGAFVLYPAPTTDFPYVANGVPNTWEEFYSSGLAVHFNKNSNLAWAFDRWWMNLFPREKPFEFSGGGYQTLSFIPTLGTMVLGFLAGRVLQQAQSPQQALRLLLASGVGLMSLAWVFDWTQICPIVKRIWTPSWTLWSGGICFLWLAALYYIADVKGWTKWAFFFLVIGANSIVAYVMSWTMERWTQDALKRHFGWLIDQVTGLMNRIVGGSESQLPLVSNFLYGGLTLLFFWLILHWLYRKRIFVRL